METKLFKARDFFFYIRKHLKVTVIFFICSCVLSYGIIFLTIEPRFKASALIIPHENESVSITALAMGMSQKMPFSFGTKSMNSEIDMYLTILYARSTLEDVINKFKLCNDYKLDTNKLGWKEEALKILKKRIVAEETDQGAFLITAIANSRSKASDMTNYLVQKLDERVIELRTNRSRQNREFLENRVMELQEQLYRSEDSLKKHQEMSGLLDVKTQLPEILTLYSTLESDLIAKRIHLAVLENLYGSTSQQVQELKITISEYEKKLDKLRREGGEHNSILAINKIPQKYIEFLRLYRQVTINNQLLEYLVPLYEQAKIDEKRDYSTLQVIDYAIPPAKKSFPPRTLLSFISGICVTIIMLFIYYSNASTVNESMSLTSNQIVNRVSKWFKK